MATFLWFKIFFLWFKGAGFPFIILILSILIHYCISHLTTFDHHLIKSIFKLVRILKCNIILAF